MTRHFVHATSALFATTSAAVHLRLNCTTVLGLIGLLSIALKLWEVVLKPLWYFFLRPPTSFAMFRGEWAVVTGASRGLGRGYALCLAKRGINVVLIARNRPTLESVAKECELLGVKTSILVADFFTEEPQAVYSRIEAHLGTLDRDVSILVNNVGGRPSGLPCEPVPCYCEDLSYVTYDSFQKANAVPPLCMTRIVLAGMVRRKKGYILNVSSINGLQACPYLSPYSATKAYVSSVSACLGNELRGRQSGVHVESVCPGPVATDGIRRNGLATRTVPEPVRFADCSLALAKTDFAEVPWLHHWWMMQSLGPKSQFWSRSTTERRLYKSMDFSKLLGPPTSG